MNRIGCALVAVLLAAVGAGAYWLGRQHAEEGPSSAAPAREAGKVLFYRNPMNPAITSPVPAKDEMGMDYIPVYADEAAAQSVPGTVSIDPTIVQDIGVRTAPVRRRELTREIRTVGVVDYDEQGLARIHLRSEGWVEHLAVAETGQAVKRGQPLLAMYSPQIVSAEQEYLVALSGAATLGPTAPAEFLQQASALVESSAERLRLLGVPEPELARLRNGGRLRRETTLVAPVSGIVRFVGVREGQYVSTQTEVYRIADLSTVWVLADLYEDEIPWVQLGDRAEIAVRGRPGDPLEARIDYIYPYLDGKTRTQKVRLQLANPGLNLKPDMYADVTLHVGRAIDALAIPESAIVRSGIRNQVFVVTGPGRFEPRTVKTGAEAGGYVQILDGLTDGEIVVSSGSFLIDSESKLREAAAKMVAPSDSQ